MIIIPNVDKENSCLDCPVWSLCWDSKPTEDICKDRCPIVEFEGVRLFDDDMPTTEAIPVEWVQKRMSECVAYSIVWIVLRDLLREWERREDDSIH